MAVLEISSFIFTVSVAGIALLRILNDSRKSICSIILNLIFGGALYAILNILGFLIPFNVITGLVVTLLGVPGVALLIILKLMFKIF